MKKALPIISYSLNIILAVVLVIMLVQKCGKGDESAKDLSSIKESMAQTERNKLPLLIQSFDRVSNIQIDSVVFTNNVEPYMGYFITQWDYESMPELSFIDGDIYETPKEEKSKQILIEFRNVRVDNKGVISWEVNWEAARFHLD